ncbi:histidine kinase [Streptomyces sp. DSM 44917]|uniref:Histidine kinase n=1 Tax=Streptomyces boetiae TaxID=3075541 RepID=A0ABU2LAL2_9ACTN|nr:histidine kinase [Streptomyces sp. DSM 44917]MDT0308589.1 histidine kinase [Streptomyces sp. DSM 44917]
MRDGSGRERRWAYPRLPARPREGPPADVLTALGVVGGLDEDLRDGLSGRGATAAVRRIRRLLNARAVVLADLDGTPVAASGCEPAPAELLSAAYEHGTPVHRPPWSVVPVPAGGELTGALAVNGGGAAAAEALAELVGRSLDHAALRRARSRIAQAELRTLRAQISPHFLHNALAVIGARIRTEPDRARTLLNDFADYLRYSFSAQGDYATVADELEAVRTYLELQRARFADRMELSVRMAPEVLPVAVPFLVIQPIVENAVRHGLEPKPGPGSISVSGFGEGPLCVIEVEDDGVGMDPEFARALLAGRSARPAPDGSEAAGGWGKVGLANVDQRLRAVYGPEYGLVIETAPGGGTKVIIRVPRFRRGVVAQ